MNAKLEYSVFPKSKYQSDGWEPFLPPHPLSDTVFEHLALEFQARKRALDEVRRSQSTNLDNDIFMMNQKETSKDSLAIDLSEVRSFDDFTNRLILVDEEYNEYLSSPRYQPSMEQIKRFLYIEARRLSCSFPGWDVSGSNFASIKNVSKLGDQNATAQKESDEDEDEEEKYRGCLLRLADLHLLPKIVETVIYLSGSGAADWITDFRSKTHTKALLLLKSAICNSISHLGISRSEISIVSIKNVTAGKLAESAEIDFQIFTYRPDLCAALATALHAAVTDGGLANRLNHHGLPVYVSLLAGPHILEYPQERDLTQRLFGSASSKLLGLRLLKFGGAVAHLPILVQPPPPPPQAVLPPDVAGDVDSEKMDDGGSITLNDDESPVPQRSISSSALIQVEPAAVIPSADTAPQAGDSQAVADAGFGRTGAVSAPARAETGSLARSRSGKRRKRFVLGPKGSMVEEGVAIATRPQETPAAGRAPHGFRLHRRAATSMGTSRYRADQVCAHILVGRAPINMPTNGARAQLTIFAMTKTKRLVRSMERGVISVGLYKPRDCGGGGGCGGGRFPRCGST